MQRKDIYIWEIQAFLKKKSKGAAEFSIPRSRFQCVDCKNVRG